MSNYDSLLIGDEVYLTADPNVKGIVHHLDSSYAFVRIGNEVLPFKYEELDLDKERALGLGLFLLSVGIFPALVWMIFGV